MIVVFYLFCCHCVYDVCVVFFVRNKVEFPFTVPGSLLEYQEQYFYLKKPGMKLGNWHFTWHKTWHYSAIGIFTQHNLATGIVLGILLGIYFCCAHVNNGHLAKSWFFLSTPISLAS